MATGGTGTVWDGLLDWYGNYQPKRSAWVPVSRNKSVSCLSFCSQVINQLGWMWHSHCPLWLPFNWWGRYSFLNLSWTDGYSQYCTLAKNLIKHVIYAIGVIVRSWHHPLLFCNGKSLWCHQLWELISVPWQRLRLLAFCKRSLLLKLSSHQEPVILLLP